MKAYYFLCLYLSVVSVGKVPFKKEFVLVPHSWCKRVTCSSIPVPFKYFYKLIICQ